MSVHSHAAAQKSSGAFFRVMGRERYRKQPGRARIALRGFTGVRPRDVMVKGAAQLRPLLSLFHRKWRHFAVKKILRDACIQINSTLYKKGGYTKKYIFLLPMMRSCV